MFLISEHALYIRLNRTTNIKFTHLFHFYCFTRGFIRKKIQFHSCSTEYVLFMWSLKLEGSECLGVKFYAPMKCVFVNTISVKLIIKIWRCLTDLTRSVSAVSLDFKDMLCHYITSRRTTNKFVIKSGITN